MNKKQDYFTKCDMCGVTTDMYDAADHYVTIPGQGHLCERCYGNQQGAADYDACRELGISMDMSDFED